MNSISKYMKNKHIPYTYLIGWSKQNKFYYGARYGKSCHPDDLWKTYFTSSKYVAEFRRKYGEPNIIQIRKTFNNADSAALWESTVLKRMDVIHSDKWINLNNGIDRRGICKGHSEGTKRKLSEANRGRRLSKIAKDKISKANKDRKLSDNHKNKLSKAATGRTQSIKAKRLIGLNNTKRANIYEFTSEKDQRYKGKIKEFCNYFGYGYNSVMNGFRLRGVYKGWKKSAIL